MTTSTAEESKSTPSSAETAKIAHCVTFILGKEIFAIDIHHIREIIEYDEIAPVPMMPVFVRGIINLRGSVVPVIDLSIRFGRQMTELKSSTCIAILSIQSKDDYSTIGILLDGVREVIEIPLASIDPAPSFGTSLRNDFIKGVTTVGGRFVILLDVQQALSVKELTILADEVAKAHISEHLSGSEN